MKLLATKSQKEGTVGLVEGVLEEEAQGTRDPAEEEV